MGKVTGMENLIPLGFLVGVILVLWKWDAILDLFAKSFRWLWKKASDYAVILILCGFMAGVVALAVWNLKNRKPPGMTIQERVEWLEVRCDELEATQKEITRGNHDWRLQEIEEKLHIEPQY